MFTPIRSNEPEDWKYQTLLDRYMAFNYPRQLLMHRPRFICLDDDYAIITIYNFEGMITIPKKKLLEYYFEITPKAA